MLPRTHGSAVFTRGETQALVTTTLGTGEDAQRLDAFEGETKKRFMLHYNFPPFSVGEVASCAALAVAKSVTEHWPSALCLPFCPTKKIRRTRFASSPTFWNRTDPRRWRRSAARRSR